MPSSDPSDSSLIPRIRAGDRVAFETLFRANVQTAFRFALSLVGDPDAAEDIVQDIFGWIWLNHTDWNPQDNPLVYLLGAIRNRALNATRNSKRRTEQLERTSGAIEVPAMGTQQSAPDHALHQSDLRAIVWSLTETLSEQRRTVLVLRWHYTLDWPEIASIMGTSINAAQVLHTRALADLRHRIPEWLRPETA